MMDRIWNQKKKLNMEFIGDVCFWLALSLEILMLILDKSSYIVVYIVWWYRIVFGLLAIKFVTSKPNRKEWAGIILLGLLGLVSKYVTDREDILRAVMIVGAASKMNLKKVMKVTFWETIIGCICIVLLSFIGIGGAIKVTDFYRGGGIEETRYCFGMGHPGAFHCMILMLLLLWTYVYYERTKWWHHVIAMVINVLCYLFTDCNQAFVIGLFASMVIILSKVFDKIQDLNCIYYLGLCIFVSCIGFSIWTAIVGVEPTWMRWIDDRILNGRLQWGSTYSTIGTWKLFGSIQYQEFFDMGWIRLVYWYGMIPAILYFVAVVIMYFETMRQKHFVSMLFITALSLYTLFEAHIFSQMVGRNYMLFFVGYYVYRNICKQKTPVR